MNSFDVWLRKRAVANPRLYGAILASEGKEIMERAESPKEPVVVRQEAPRNEVPPPAMDFKSRAAGDDSQDAEVVEDLGLEEAT